MTDIKNLTIKQAHEHLKNKDFSAVELAQEYKKNIEQKNADLNAYLEMFNDIEDQAKKADEKIKAGDISLLTGIPLSVKDNILIKGRKVSAASKMLENYVASYDSTVAEKLKKEGAVFLGRTNMDEFAMGGSTENSAYGVVKNPWDISRVPGGSSGGAAASLAADMCLASLGSDTGGSIRQPASFCGVVGLKPTYGAVSRYGLMAMASSLDQIGPITKTVEDAEIIFNAIKGKDLMDSTSANMAEVNGGFGEKEKKENKNSKKFRIGVPRDFLKEGVDPDVLENFEDSLKKLQEAGCEIVDVSLPNMKYSLAVYYILMPAEVSSNLARFDGVKYGLLKEGKDLLEDYLLTRQEGFGKETRRRIMLGTYVLSSGYYDAYYYKAHEVRREIIKDFERALETADVIATPTAPTPAFKIGEKASDPLSMYLSDIFTVSANIVTLPAISIPSGFTERENKKLPLGIQFTGKYAGESELFSLGSLFEKIRV